MQDYKSLCVAVMISSRQISTQSRREHFDQLICKTHLAEQKMTEIAVCQVSK